MSQINYRQDNRKPSSGPIHVIVQGPVVPKGRPRFSRRGQIYTPQKTSEYEAHVKQAAWLAMNGRPPIELPVKVELLVELPIPTSWSKRRTAAAITGAVRPITRPDIDNYCKSIIDAVSGVVLVNDAQVVELHATKRFGVTPKMIMTVFPLAESAGDRAEQIRLRIEAHRATQDRLRRARDFRRRTETASKRLQSNRGAA